MERSLYVKLKDWISNSIDPDEMAHCALSDLDLCCLQKPIMMACGSERVKVLSVVKHWTISHLHNMQGVVCSAKIHRKKM